MSRLSHQMQLCKEGLSHLQLNYNGEYFSHPWYFHGTAGYILFFDPWSGMPMEESFQTLELDESIDKNQWLNDRLKERKCHDAVNIVCSLLTSFLKDGEEEGMTSIIHIPNIRTYAILNKKEYGGFEPMDYCPFCGAKLPERLDDRLTEILQKEYGLNSWRDYKKAPAEFH
ncbi:MAG: hypothetical protein K5766_01165, partial [Alphaproteobacteria bacterium]|nr:hypothetical protein [Alphaproteobacteria bacterium]